MGSSCPLQNTEFLPAPAQRAGDQPENPTWARWGFSVQVCRMGQTRSGPVLEAMDKQAGTSTGPPASSQ
jgi:hypothetical protein